MSKAEDVSNYRRRRKQNLIQVLGGKCQICGFDLFADALEFHHEDPTKKDYGISSKGTCHDIETDLNEVKKCFLLCANCHRGVHNGYYNAPTEHIFNNELAQRLINERNDKMTAKLNYCIDCHCQIDSTATRCPSCAAKARRVCERPSREDLKQLIRTLSFTQIGEQFGVGDNSIRKWCDSMNLPRTKKEINSYSDEEWELI